MLMPSLMCWKRKGKPFPPVSAAMSLWDSVRCLRDGKMVIIHKKQ